jgi:probable O-glycosylation ligase (exosortase A-associated)
MTKGLIFTYALTVVGSLAGLVHPYYGLLAYIILAILRPGGGGMWQYEVPSGIYARVVGVAMLAGWAIYGFGKWDFRRAGVVLGAMMLFWAWHLPSALFAADPARGWGVAEFYLKIFLPVLVGVTTIDKMWQVKTLAWVIVLCQGWVALELNGDFYRGYNRVWEEGFGAMDNNCVAISMVTGIGFAFFLGLGSGTPWYLRLVAFATAAMMTNVIMFSYSRGGMLSLAITGGLAFLLIKKSTPHYLAFAAAVLIGIRLMGPEAQERFSTTFTSGEYREASAQSRLDLWANCIELGVRNPIFGIGPDNFGVYAPQFGWPKGKEAHSLWVQAFAEVGVAGVTFLLSFFVLAIARLWPLTREKTPVSDPWMRDAARMVIASLIGFMISAQFVTIRSLELPFYVVLVGCCVLVLQGRAEESSPPPATTEDEVALREPGPAVAVSSGF